MGRRTIAGPIAAALVAGTVLLAGCSGQSSDRTTAGAPGAARLAESGGGAAAAPSATAQSAAPTAVGGAARIRTAELSLTVTDRAELARRADQAAVLAVRLNGEVQSEDRGRDYATLRLRVPPARLTTALRTMGRYGRVTALETSTRDVTEQVADVSSRVRSARDAIARLRTLYTSATRVADVLSVERQLSSREADLEALQARQRALSEQTSLATVAVDLRVGSEGGRHDRSGFLAGLGRGWGAFTGALAATTTGIGTALPFAVPAVVIVLLGLVGRRRRRAAASGSA